MRLTADGKLKNCLFSNGETDLLTSFRNGEDILPLINAKYQKQSERTWVDSLPATCKK